MNLLQVIKNRFYGLMAVLTYLSCLYSIQILKNEEPFNKIPNLDQHLKIVIYIYLFFARLFYCLLDSPKKFTIWNFFQIYKGGLSSFGGQFSTMIYLYMFCKINNYNLIYLYDITAILVPIPGILIRLGNYVNNEMQGRYMNNVSILEMILHGFIYGIIILYTYKYHYTPGITTSIYIKYYCTIRFFTEFIREKKKYYNLNFSKFNLGVWQICCLLTINPYFILFIFDQYIKQYTNKIIYTSKIDIFSYIIKILMLIVLPNINMIFFMGFISNICDIIFHGGIRQYIPVIKNFGNIYIFLGMLLYILRIDICKSSFYFDYNTLMNIDI